MVGELDTNVDPASTFRSPDAPHQGGKDFDLLVAPGVGHGVAGTVYGRRRLQDFLRAPPCSASSPRHRNVAEKQALR
jgi:hypothetical protein